MPPPAVACTAERASSAPEAASNLAPALGHAQHGLRRRLGTAARALMIDALALAQSIPLLQSSNSSVAGVGRTGLASGAGTAAAPQRSQSPPWRPWVSRGRAACYTPGPYSGRIRIENPFRSNTCAAAGDGPDVLGRPEAAAVTRARRSRSIRPAAGSVTRVCRDKNHGAGLLSLPCAGRIKVGGRTP